MIDVNKDGLVDKFELKLARSLLKYTTEQNIFQFIALSLHIIVVPIMRSTEKQ